MVVIHWPRAIIRDPAYWYTVGGYQYSHVGPVTIAFHTSPVSRSDNPIFFTYAPNATRGYSVDTLQWVWINADGAQDVALLYALHPPGQPYINGLTSR